MPQSFMNCQSTTLFISGAHSNIHCGRGQVQTSHYCTETLRQRELCKKWISLLSHLSKWLCCHVINVKTPGDGPFMSLCGGEKTHAKRYFNQLQKHWMCVVQITGNKKNRADAITRIKEGALLLASPCVKRELERLHLMKSYTLSSRFKLYQKWQDDLAQVTHRTITETPL